MGVKDRGVTGREVQVPIASWGVGGVVGRRERRVLVWSRGWVWTYWDWG